MTPLSQAKSGIRSDLVTGVQACALPTSSGAGQILPIPILEFLGSPTFRRRALMSAPSISGISHTGGEHTQLIPYPAVHPPQFPTNRLPVYLKPFRAPPPSSRRPPLAQTT